MLSKMPKITKLFCTVDAIFDELCLSVLTYCVSCDCSTIKAILCFAS